MLPLPGLSGWWAQAVEERQSTVKGSGQHNCPLKRALQEETPGRRSGRAYSLQPEQRLTAYLVD